MSSAAELKTRVRFFEFGPTPGPEPGEKEEKTVWECWGEVYEPSIKDSEALSSPSTNYTVTIRIRNPLGEYKPKADQYVSVLDSFYDGIRFNIKNIHPDVKSKKYIKIVAEAENHGG